MEDQKNSVKGKTIIKWVALVLGVLIIVSVLFVSCIINDPNFYLLFDVNMDGKTCTVRGCSWLSESNVVIPEKYKNYTVTAIADHAFMDKNITSITLPSTINSIGEGAFLACELLESVYGLENCLSLKMIRDDTFYGCSSLKSIPLPPNLIDIGKMSFLGCENLENIQFPDTLMGIGGGAFAGCISLEKIDIPDSVISIKPGAFFMCHSLKEITLPPFICDLDTADICVNCDSLINIYTPQSSWNFSSVDGVLYSKDQTNLHFYPSGRQAEAFAVPNNVQVITSTAFGYNPYLKEISIPASVKTIFYSVIKHSINLTVINYDGTVEDWNAIEKDPIWDEDSADYTVYCTDGQIAKNGTVTYK